MRECSLQSQDRHAGKRALKKASREEGALISLAKAKLPTASCTFTNWGFNMLYSSPATASYARACRRMKSTCSHMRAHAMLYSMSGKADMHAAHTPAWRQGPPFQPASQFPCIMCMLHAGACFLLCTSGKHGTGPVRHDPTCKGVGSRPACMRAWLEGTSLRKRCLNRVALLLQEPPPQILRPAGHVLMSLQLCRHKPAIFHAWE